VPRRYRSTRGRPTNANAVVPDRDSRLRSRRPLRIPTETRPVGRYIEPDPMGLKGGRYSVYPYVGESPTMRTDWSGLAWNVVGNKLNQFLQDRLPSSWCDIRPEKCTADSIKCVAARCRYSDCNGNKWDVVVYSWLLTARRLRKSRKKRLNAPVLTISGGRLSETQCFLKHV
jgi:hypothetical protein